jgi:hypothetical protein
VKRSQCDVILDLLRAGEATTLELMQESGSLAPHSRVSELRSRGHDIEHRRVVRIRADGQRRMVSVYRLVQNAAA